MLVSLTLMNNLNESTFHLLTPTCWEFFRAVIQTCNNKRCCVSLRHLNKPRRLYLRLLLYKVQQYIDRSPRHTFKFGYLESTSDAHQEQQLKSYFNRNSHSAALT